MPALDNLLAMGAPAAINWTIRQKDNPYLQFTVKYNGTPVDMTGVTGICNIRASYLDGATLLATPTVTFPTPLSSGRVRIALTTAQSDALKTFIPTDTSIGQQLVTIGVWDVDLADGTNHVTVAGGQAILSRQVQQ